VKTNYITMHSSYYPMLWLNSYWKNKAINVYSLIYFLYDHDIHYKKLTYHRGTADAPCQLKSCQLQHDSAETTCTTSPEQIEVMKLEG